MSDEWCKLKRYTPTILLSPCTGPYNYDQPKNIIGHYSLTVTVGTHAVGDYDAKHAKSQISLGTQVRCNKEERTVRKHC